MLDEDFRLLFWTYPEDEASEKVYIYICIFALGLMRLCNYRSNQSF